MHEVRRLFSVCDKLLVLKVDVPKRWSTNAHLPLNARKSHFRAASLHARSTYISC